MSLAPVPLASDGVLPNPSKYHVAIRNCKQCTQNPAKPVLSAVVSLVLPGPFAEGPRARGLNHGVTEMGR